MKLTYPALFGVVRRTLAISLFAVTFATGCSSPSPQRGVATSSTSVDRPVSITSPDGTLAFTLQTGGPLTYSISVDGTNVLAGSRLGLKFQDGVTVGEAVRLLRVERRRQDKSWQNAFGKRRHVRDRHNEMEAHFAEASGREFAITVRAFDDGIAFRYELPKTRAVSQDFLLLEEQTTFAFPENHLCYVGENENTGKKENPLGYIGSQESEYLPMHLADLPTQQVRMLPLLVKTPVAWLVLTESDLLDWAGMWVSRSTNAVGPGVTIAARLAPRPDAAGLVRSTFPRHSPWRTFVIAREPGRLIESDLVLNLASESVLSDTSWVKPGIASWDWWPQMTQPSTATYKELIQFASEMGWPYTLLDAGWSSRSSILEPSASVHMDEVLAFAREKNVRPWLWLHWSSLERDEVCQQAFALYEKWGVAGVKVDFMNRDDQDMVNWYEKITRAAAAHHLMVNFHGAFKPTGLNRTYPNQITREGILGNEYNRWSARVTPEYKTTMPFVRMVAGPGDFTPGGFLNRPPDQFRFNVKPTQVQGTRCAELALFVCLESPITHAADHPSHYRNQPGLDFLKIVPTVWDETRALDAAVGEHLVMARRKDAQWFLAALTNRRERDLPVKLDFLGLGTWVMKLWKDAPDSSTNGEHLETEQRFVNSGETVNLHLAPAGGAVAWFEPVLSPN